MSIDGDGNMYALNKHLDEVDKAEAAQEAFEASVSDQLQKLSELVCEIKASANDFWGYDMSELADELIKDNS